MLTLFVQLRIAKVKTSLLGPIEEHLAKPAAAKGQYVRSCVVATTMGPGVKINPARFVAVATTEN